MKKGGTKKLFLFFINDLFSNNLFKNHHQKLLYYYPGFSRSEKLSPLPQFPTIYGSGPDLQGAMSLARFRQPPEAMMPTQHLFPTKT